MADIPDEAAWNAWHPRDLRARLAGVDRPWCVVGGWALDLWHGRVTRPHQDLEFTVLREDFGNVRHALSAGDAGLRFYTVEDGVFAPLPDGIQPGPEITQIWCWDVPARAWRVDIMIEPGTPRTWICKRDHAITRPRSEAVLVSPEGIPYLAPAAILLLKARHMRPKDLADFEITLPTLEALEKAWLRDSLAQLDAGHPWIARIVP